MALVRMLSRYLRQNPNACDTPEGIARWWLPLDTPPRSTALTLALESMQKSGLVEPLRAADGHVRLRRCAFGPAADARLDALSVAQSIDELPAADVQGAPTVDAARTRKDVH